MRSAGRHSTYHGLGPGQKIKKEGVSVRLGGIEALNDPRAFVSTVGIHAT
jgi:hypothetical protein